MLEVCLFSYRRIEKSICYTQLFFSFLQNTDKISGNFAIFQWKL